MIVLGVVTVMIAIPSALYMQTLGQEAVSSAVDYSAEALQAAQAGIADYQAHLNARPVGYAEAYCSPATGKWTCGGATTTDTSDPAFVSNVDGTCRTSPASSAGWLLDSGSSTGANSQYQFVVNSSAVTPASVASASGAMVYVYATGRAGPYSGATGRYTCRTVKAAFQVKAQGLSPPPLASCGTTATVTVPSDANAMVVTVTGAAGAAGTQGSWAASAGTGGTAQQVVAEFTGLHAGTSYTAVTGCKATGPVGGMGFAAGGDAGASAGGGGVAGGGGGGASALCAGAGSCNAGSTPLVVAGGGGGGGGTGNLCFIYNGGNGGNGGAPGSPGGYFDFFGWPGIPYGGAAGVSGSATNAGVGQAGYAGGGAGGGGYGSGGGGTAGTFCNAGGGGGGGASYVSPSSPCSQIGVVSGYEGCGLTAPVPGPVAGAPGALTISWQSAASNDFGTTTLNDSSFVATSNSAYSSRFTVLHSPPSTGQNCANSAATIEPPSGANEAIVTLSGGSGAPAPSGGAQGGQGHQVMATISITGGSPYSLTLGCAGSGAAGGSGLGIGGGGAPTTGGGAGGGGGASGFCSGTTCSDDTTVGDPTYTSWTSILAAAGGGGGGGQSGCNQSGVGGNGGGGTEGAAATSNSTVTASGSLGPIFGTNGTNSATGFFCSAGGNGGAAGGVSTASGATRDGAPGTLGSGSSTTGGGGGGGGFNGGGGGQGAGCSGFFCGVSGGGGGGGGSSFVIPTGPGGQGTTGVTFGNTSGDGTISIDWRYQPTSSGNFTLGCGSPEYIDTAGTGTMQLTLQGGTGAASSGAGGLGEQATATVPFTAAGLVLVVGCQGNGSVGGAGFVSGGNGGPAGSSGASGGGGGASAICAAFAVGDTTCTGANALLVTGGGGGGGQAPCWLWSGGSGGAGSAPAAVNNGTAGTIVGLTLPYVSGSGGAGASQLLGQNGGSGGVGSPISGGTGGGGGGGYLSGAGGGGGSWWCGAGGGGGGGDSYVSPSVVATGPVTWGAGSSGDGSASYPSALCSTAAGSPDPCYIVDQANALATDVPVVPGYLATGAGGVW